MKRNNELARTRVMSGSLGTYNGNTYRANGRTWSGALAKQMYTYDTKRYSSSPTVRASAASYGRQLHEKLWGDTLRRNNLATRNRPLIGKMGTTHADGSYTSASGRHFKPGITLTAIASTIDYVHQAIGKPLKGSGKRLERYSSMQPFI